MPLALDTEDNIFADLLPDNVSPPLIGGETPAAPAYQTVNGQTTEVPKAITASFEPPDLGPFLDLVETTNPVPVTNYEEQFGMFSDLVPQLTPETDAVQQDLQSRVDAIAQDASGVLPRGAQGERPPFAEKIAGWLDSFGNAVTGGRVGTVLEDLVRQGTYEPNPGEPSFTNAGIPTIPQQEGTAAQVGAGLANTGIGFANFALSAGGLATLNTLGMTPKLVRTLTGAGFSAEQVHQFLNAETTQDRVSSAAGAFLLGLGTAADAFSKAPVRPASASEAAPAPPIVPPTETVDVTAQRPGEQPIPQTTEPATPVSTTTAGGELRPEGGENLPAALSENQDILPNGRINEARMRSAFLDSDGSVRLGASDEHHGDIHTRLYESGQTDIEPGKPAHNETGWILGNDKSTFVSVQDFQNAKGDPDLAFRTKYPEKFASVPAEQNPFQDLMPAEITGGGAPENFQPAREAAPPEAPPPEQAAAPAEPFGFGPGAAASGEKLASYELRRFGQRFQQTEAIAPDIREATGNRYYEPIPNKVTLADADRIIEERGTEEAVRLVRDEQAKIEPRVRVTLGQRLIEQLNRSQLEAKAAGDARSVEHFSNQAIDTAEHLSELGTRYGQGVQAYAIWRRLFPDDFVKVARRTAERADVKLTPEQEAEIRRLNVEAQAAPEGIPQQDAFKKLADYMAQQIGIPVKNLPLSIYYTHILSGINTQAVNFVDTGLNVWHEANNLAVANPRAAAAIYRGLVRGLGEGKSDAALAFLEGRRITSGKFLESPEQIDLLEASKFGQKGGVPIADTGRIARVTKRIAESRIAKPLNYYKYVMRAMNASDSVMFRGAEEGRAALLAFRVAEEVGVKGRKAVKAEIDRILGYDRLPDFRDQAKREGYSGAKAEARATELMIQSRPAEIREGAQDFAGIATYNHEPRGAAGYFANQTAQMSNRYPALKLFVPFTRIVANVWNRGIDNTPFGIYRALRGGKEALTGEKRQIALTRGIVGTAGIASLGVLAATGLIDIHGQGPSDRERRRQLMAGGWKPYSIQVGDNYFTYTYTPMGLGLSALGNFLDAQRYNELSQKDAITRATYAVSRIGSTFFSQSFLSGLSRLFDILSGDPGQSIGSLKNFFASTVTGAVAPNLLRDVNSIFDPSSRKSASIGEDLVRNIPVIRLALKPTLNAYGDPVELSRNRFYSARVENPEWRIVVDKNLRVPVADQTTFESEDDGYDYAKMAGAGMKAYVKENLGELQAATPEDAQTMLSKAARKIFDQAREDISERGGVRRRKKKR